MNDKELLKILEQKETPPLSQESVDRITNAAVSAYKQSGLTPSNQNQPLQLDLRKPVAFLPVLIAACLILLLLGPGAFIGKTQQPASKDYTGQDSLAMFEEHKILFGNQLKGLVAYNGGVDILLNDAATNYSNPVILIQLESNGHKAQIIAHSGHQIDVYIGNKTISMDLLISSDGQIILSSQEFLLEGGQYYGPSSLSAKTQLIGAEL